MSCWNLKVVRNRYEQVCGKVQIMYLVLTSGCNLACKYCFIENSTYNNNKEITMQFSTALPAIKKYSDYINENSNVIGVGFLMPTPWPLYINDYENEQVSLLWEHYEYKYKKHLF